MENPSSCLTHPDQEKVTDCSVCGHALCRACLYYADGDPYCLSCVSMVEREFETEQKKRTRRAVLSMPVGLSIGVATVLGWRWLMFQTAFGMMMLTPMIMIVVILGMAVLMCRIAGARSQMLFAAGAVLAIGIMLGEEYIEYDYAIYQTAQQGTLSAENLLRVVEKNTYVDHLQSRGIFTYFFFGVGIFLTWRRLWPLSKDEFIIIRPEDIENSR